MQFRATDDRHGLHIATLDGLTFHLLMVMPSGKSVDRSRLLWVVVDRLYKIQSVEDSVDILDES